MTYHAKPPLKPFRQVEELVAAGLIPKEGIELLRAVTEKFALRLPVGLAERMEHIDNLPPGGDSGPLARQYLPDARELLEASFESADPIGDEAFTPVAGIVHRYPDRVLLKANHLCPAYCRFCFRNNTVGPNKENHSNALSADELETALAYIEALMLPMAKISHILERLDSIPHVAVVRLHSRVPVAEPARISGDLVAALRTPIETAIYVVVHCNHADELDTKALAACHAMSDSGIPLLGQTVLLKGVNDDADVLEALFRTMVRHRIKPYYLHHCDLARGTGHFRTTIARGQELMRELRGHISGLCQPTYVLDIPGGHGKVPLTPVYLTHQEDGNHDGTGDTYRVEDYQGGVHAYPSITDPGVSVVSTEPE
jgi:lysine 2,3-aminomutase